MESQDKPQQPEWLIPDYPPLDIKDATGQSAVNGQLHSYPKVVRTRADPPLTGQRLGCLSFMLFDEVKTLRNGKKVHGFVKLRGNWADETLARHESKKIVCEVDSKYQILIAPVGEWVPITDEQSFIKEMYDVDDEDSPYSLRGDAAKKRDAEERRKMREIQENAEEAEFGPTPDDDPESLDYYTMKMSVENTLIEARDNEMKKIEDIKRKLRKTQRILKRLEVDHPEYREAWLDHYNAARAKVGLVEYVPTEQHIREHDEAEFDNYDSTDEEEETGRFIDTYKEEDYTPQNNS